MTTRKSKAAAEPEVEPEVVEDDQATDEDGALPDTIELTPAAAITDRLNQLAITLVGSPVAISATDISNAVAAHTASEDGSA